MAIDAKKLSSYAGAAKPPSGRRFGVGKKKTEPQEPSEDAEAVAREGEPDVLAEGEDSDEEPNPAAVLPFLEQYPEEVMACCDELDYDTLIDPEMPLTADNAQILQEGALVLPPRLQRLLPNFIGITYEDAGVLAQALLEREKIEDAEVVAGWIFRIGQTLAGEYEEAEGDPENMPEDDGEDDGEEALPA